MARPRTTLAFAIAAVLAPAFAHAQTGATTPQDNDTTAASAQQSQGDAVGAQDAAAQAQAGEQDPPRSAAARTATDAERRAAGRVGERSTANPAQTRRDAVGAQIGAQGDARGNAASGAATGAAATRSMGATGGLWGTLDADGDGRVSEDEGRVDADFRANFEMMDADGDGFVSPDEFRDGRPEARTDRSGRDR